MDTNKLKAIFKDAENGSTTQINDERMYEYLIRTLQNSNVKGFDYLEFKNTLAALKDIPLDEATKYKTALATASASHSNVSVGHLSKSILFYISVLEKEKEKFRTDLERSAKDKLANKNNLKSQLNNAIEQKQAQIQQLTAAINNHKNQLQDLEEEIDGIEGKVEETKNNYLQAFNHIYSQLQADKDKVNQLL